MKLHEKLFCLGLLAGSIKLCIDALMAPPTPRWSNGKIATSADLTVPEGAVMH